MDKDIFRKMKVKPEMNGKIINAPDTYPADPYFRIAPGKAPDFTHLFISSREELEENFEKTAAEVDKKNGLFWISYHKSTGKNRYDINRDSLWDLVIPHGWHPVAQISLDEEWSAVRIKSNEEGKVYKRPGTNSPK